MRRVRIAVLAATVLASACGGSRPGGPSGSASPGAGGAPAPSATPAPANGEVRVRIEPIALLHEPVAMAVRSGDPTLYVAQKSGEVMAYRNGAVERTPVVDLSATVLDVGEQGLLGLAFSPDGATLYASYDDLDGNTNLVAYPFSGGAARTPGRRILFVRQPFANHKGGDVHFGPDGMLYLGLGDGGNEGDPGDRSQSLRTLLGKMIRIDPTPGGPEPYRVPASNPFVGRPGARPEIWAYGLRNPWRWSFDRVTRELWIGDVGQGTWEEVDREPIARAGVNYGWSCFEGAHPFKRCRPANAVKPVYEYSHTATGGCAIAGGYVYRGSAIRGLRGAYLFGDYCVGRLMGLRRTDGGMHAWALGPTVAQLEAFGEDARGELYALSLNGAIYRILP